jgi:hypothetical protein
MGHPVISKVMAWTSDVSFGNLQHIGWKQSLGKKEKNLATML